MQESSESGMKESEKKRLKKGWMRKENQTEKIREKVIQEVEVENNMLDTKDSVNEVIRKDISQEK